MPDEFDFQPKLGKIKDRGLGTPRFSNQVLAAINRAGGRRGAKSKFTGSRIGRGGAMGAWLAHRDKYASFRHRRAIVKSRIVKLAGKGMNNAAERTEAERWFGCIKNKGQSGGKNA